MRLQSIISSTYNTIFKGKFQVKNILNYILIGFVQGITEFLPVSSSGHIVLFGSLFEMDNLLLLSVVAHIGTLFAVIFCYRQRIKELIRKPFNATNLNLVLATIPTVIVVLLFNDFLEKNFSNSVLVWGFLASAVLLMIADFKKNNIKPVDKKHALYMGIAQSLAILPGISRSGTTLVAGLLTGVEKQQALDFSFLMSIPVILASAVYETIKLFSCQVTVDWAGVIVVIITAFVSGILSIKIMLKLVKKNRLIYFSFYLILLSLVVLLFV